MHLSEARFHQYSTICIFIISSLLNLWKKSMCKKVFIWQCINYVIPGKWFWCSIWTVYVYVFASSPRLCVEKYEEKMVRTVRLRCTPLSRAQLPQSDSFTELLFSRMKKINLLNLYARYSYCMDRNIVDGYILFPQRTYAGSVIYYSALCPEMLGRRYKWDWVC